MMTMSETVDLDKLSLVAGTNNFRRDSVNFARLTDCRFQKRVSVTNRIRTNDESKKLYNEAQQTSLDFGVTSQEMIEFYNRQKLSTAFSTSTVGLSRGIQSQLKRSESFKRHGIVLMDTEGHKCSTNTNVSEPMNEDDNPFLDKCTESPPERPKTRPLSIYTLREVDSANVRLMKRERLSRANDSEPAREGNSLSKRKSSTSLRRVSTNIFRRSSTISSKTTSSVTTLQKECHSVEDTLLADEEFNDFSIPPRNRASAAPNSSYESTDNNNELFVFENPLDSPGSLRTMNHSWSSAKSTPPPSPMASPNTMGSASKRKGWNANSSGIQKIVEHEMYI